MFEKKSNKQQQQQQIFRRSHQTQMKRDQFELLDQEVLR